MSGDTEIARMLAELGELSSADLLDEPRDLARVVVERGDKEGVRLLEAYLYAHFKPEAVAKALPFYTRHIHTIAHTYPETFRLMEAKLMLLMEDAADEPPEANIPLMLSADMLVLRGVAAGQFKHTTILPDIALRGRVNILQETISDHRTGHRDLFSNIRLRPTRKALDAPKFDRAAAFTAALDELKCWVPGNGKERLITETKAVLHDHLHKKHTHQFGLLETFERNYARNGKWAGNLGFRIQWMHNHNRDRS